MLNHTWHTVSFRPLYCKQYTCVLTRGKTAMQTEVQLVHSFSGINKLKWKTCFFTTSWFLYKVIHTKVAFYRTIHLSLNVIWFLQNKNSTFYRSCKGIVLLNWVLVCFSSFGWSKANWKTGCAAMLNPYSHSHIMSPNILISIRVLGVLHYLFKTKSTLWLFSLSF